ncbi:MAG: TraB/GumN family protein [Cypionkella sp.]
MPRRFLVALLLALWPVTAPAMPCHGQDLIATLPADQLASLKARADAAPFARGNLWHATKDGKTITLAGTYHLADPRFAPILATLAPYLHAATTLLVESGPVEEAALQAKILKDPSQMFALKGPTLPERMSKDDWQSLADALRARGMVPALEAKMQPWLVATLLSLPACMYPLGPNAEQGLDKQLMAQATARNLPIVSLEPYDTALGIFGNVSPADQLVMLTQAVAADAQAEDLAATLSNSYFAGESRLYLEWSRMEAATQPGMTSAEADRQTALVDDTMLAKRNAAWIAKLEQAAETGPALAAFGALHLSGEVGVLNLLAQRGWTITPLTSP